MCHCSSCSLSGHVQGTFTAWACSGAESSTQNRKDFRLPVSPERQERGPQSWCFIAQGALAGRVRDYIDTENSISFMQPRSRWVVWAAVSCGFLNGARSDSSPWLSPMSGESLPLSVKPAHIYFNWPCMTPDPPYDPIILCKNMFLCPQMPCLSSLTVSDKYANNILTE